MRSKPSLRDLAKLANVSAATVSRVARGQTTVDPAIRERVRKAAQELGLDLQQRRHDKSASTVFVLSNRDVLHGFQARVLVGAESYFAERQVELLFISFRYSAAVPSAQLALPHVLERRTLVRSAILAGTNYPNLLQALQEREIPFAVLGNNVVGDWTPSAHDVVYSDDTQGAYDLTSQLIADGHREICFIGDRDLPWYARCSEGYSRRMREAGLQPRFSEIQSDGLQLGYLAMRSVLSGREPVSAVFAGSDPIARGAYDAARQAGFRIPEDICIAGFNDTEANLMYPPLTSVREFPEELGRHLAEFVLTRMQDPSREPRQLTLPTQVIVRESTRISLRNDPLLVMHK
jgi:DNA-binding LacI/PurR family transcriptional regulator